MSDFLRSYLTVGIFLGVGVLLVAALLGVASLLRPSKPSPQKHIVYEAVWTRSAPAGHRARSATTSSPCCS
ncbi:MAG: hypothetical protein R2755_25145 [Acidimicrobiales bacterium]